MRFAWPFALLSLLVVPALAGLYVWQLRRRRRRVVTFSSIALLRAAGPRPKAWRRHVPVALLLLALTFLGLAAARPQVSARVPVSQSALILALDVSGSMCATDVDPNRLTAAQAAVRRFVSAQDDGTRVGLVVFSGSAQLAVPPTTEHDDVLDAIDGLTTGWGTVIGAAILKSLDAIAELDPDVAPADTGASPAVPQQKPAGEFAPEIVVLLTDGANTQGVEPKDAAAIAASRGVRVYPIGFGTSNPTGRSCTAAQLGGAGDGFGRGFGGGFGAGGGRGGRSPLVADEETLKAVATTTGGVYFAAQDGGQLQRVLDDLPRQVTRQERQVEVAVVAAGLAGLLLLLTVWAAQRWTAFPG